MSGEKTFCVFEIWRQERGSNSRSPPFQALPLHQGPSSSNFNQMNMETNTLTGLLKSSISDAGPAINKCWTDAFLDSTIQHTALPTSNQHWINALCLLDSLQRTKNYNMCHMTIIIRSCHYQAAVTCPVQTRWLAESHEVYVLLIISHTLSAASNAHVCEAHGGMILHKLVTHTCQELQKYVRRTTSELTLSSLKLPLSSSSSTSRELLSQFSTSNGWRWFDVV